MKSHKWIAGLVLLSTSSWACGPFDFRVVRGGGGATRGGAKGSAEENAKKPKLTWAEAVLNDKNATDIFSDVQFFQDSPNGGWRLSPGDSKLSQEMTLLEMLGFWAELKDEKGKPFLEKKDLAGVIQSWQQDRERFRLWEVAPRCLKEYPAAYGCEMGQIEAAMNFLFPEKSRAMLASLEKQNQDNRAGKGTYELRYYKRKSFLDSKFSPSEAAGCMAIAFGQDYFTNPLEEGVYVGGVEYAPDHKDYAAKKEIYRNTELIGGTYQTFQASIVDQAAAEALKKFKASANKSLEAPLSVTFAVNGLNCKLVPSTNKLEVIRTRCGGGDTAQAEKFHQSNPVVRMIDDKYGQFGREVQLGMNLYTVECDSVSMSYPAEGAAVKPLLTKALGKAGQKGSIADGMEVLSALPVTPDQFEAKKKTVLKAADACYQKFINQVGSVAGPGGYSAGG